MKQDAIFEEILGAKQKTEDVPTVDKDSLALAQAKREKNVYLLSRYYFNFFPTKGQEEIIRVIAYAEDPRVIINCMTRYGKTKAVSIAVCLYILLHSNKKILCIGPRYDTTAILRNYIAELIVDSAVMSTMLEGQNRGIQRIKKNLSRKRITFNNGCELLLLSAEGSAQRLMGFGGDVIIIDESCQIKKEVFTGKISRMLGDNETSVLIEISNPVNRDNHYYEHWLNPRYRKIHIGWRQALKEGRVSLNFLQEQAPLGVVLTDGVMTVEGLGGMTPLEWQVLYESEFPDQSEDALIPYTKILKATEQRFDFEVENRIISCDPADKGKDLTVIMRVWQGKGQWKVNSIYSENKSEHVKVATRILAMQQEDRTNQIKIDYGMGVGIISMVKAGLQVKHCHVFSAMFGSGANDKRRFLNKKAEMYFYLAELFINEQIQIPKHELLIKQLVSMKWEKTVGDKIKIIDPEDKSPDFADALVIAVWKFATPSYHLA